MKRQQLFFFTFMSTTRSLSTLHRLIHGKLRRKDVIFLTLKRIKFHIKNGCNLPPQAKIVIVRVHREIKTTFSAQKVEMKTAKLKSIFIIRRSHNVGCKNLYYFSNHVIIPASGLDHNLVLHWIQNYFASTGRETNRPANRKHIPLSKTSRMSHQNKNYKNIIKSFLACKTGVEIIWGSIF